MLTQEQMRKSLTWCLEHRNTDWSKVVFRGILWTLQQQDSRLDDEEKDDKENVKIFTEIHVWGAISFRSTSTLGIFGCNVNSEINCDVLHENLPSIEDLFPDGFQFQQDKAPPHVSRYTASWMSSNDVQPIKWPPGSPDLKSIENK